MSTEWIEAVLRTNAQIIAAEACVHAQVARLLEMGEQGQHTTEAEGQLLIGHRKLARLRTIQAQLLRDTATEA